MTLATKTKELQDSRQHLQDAIEALQRNEAVPSGNSLSQVLQAQFSKLASDDDKTRSINLLTTMMTQLSVDLESHERALTAASQRVSHGVDRLNDLARRYKFAVIEAENLLKEIASLSQNLDADRIETGYSKPLAKIVGTFAAPTVEVG